MGPITIGVDLGQQRDRTAIAVAELEDRQGDEYHIIRRLERLPLRTPYHEVAARLTIIVEGVRLRAMQDEMDRLVLPRWERGPEQEIMPTVYVDATGLGKPVIDALAVAGVPLVSVYFTYGDKRLTQGEESMSLGKAWLVSRLQVLLQAGHVLLPKTAEAAALATDLRNYEITMTPDANERDGAFSVGTHDDLVTALGLAVQPQPGRMAFLDPEIADLIQNGWMREMGA